MFQTRTFWPKNFGILPGLGECSQKLKDKNTKIYPECVSKSSHLELCIGSAVGLSGHSIKGKLGVLDANLEVRTECESELIALKRTVIHTVAKMAKKTLTGGYCNRVVFPFWL